MHDTTSIPGYRIIIAGGRDFGDYDHLEIALDSHLAGLKPVLLITGVTMLEYEHMVKRAKDRKEKLLGADYLAWQYALARNLPMRGVAADWDRLGKAAGPIRNRAMGQLAISGPGGEKAAYLIAFWDRKSPGTRDMIAQAEACDIKTMKEYY